MQLNYIENSKNKNQTATSQKPEQNSISNQQITFRGGPPGRTSASQRSAKRHRGGTDHRPGRYTAHTRGRPGSANVSQRKNNSYHLLTPPGLCRDARR